ncbi:helix-turn-helix transcriptional regulator [Streptomyces montanisoli]|uniref:Helix-turn-helix transcriptional regulator n=1 Tax=Streptomyces montanisoli TaxID=2798581 RepID=A0A940M8S3_9ACTN|nr:helix-turn-helix transcriptional regulator [Streptomyces montanisoli]MBP0456011.1 helix-turn-helix transcriptional regulator [Streptomyces montanisoli]
MTEEVRHDDDSLLPAEARELYARLAAGQSADPGTPGLADLEARGLALRDPISGLVSVVGMEHVEQRLHASVKKALDRSVRLYSELPAVLDDLRGRQPAPDRGRASVVAFISGQDAVNRAISTACDTAESEVLCAQPGYRAPRTLSVAEDRDALLLARGIALHTLYHVSSKANQAVHDRVRVIAPKGGRFRTLAGPFLLMVIIDRKSAFLVDRLNGRAAKEGAWQVRDPAVCAFLADVFEQQWNRADDWFNPAPADEDVVTTPLQRAILRELCVGHDQQQIAKALGYSARTINAHLTDLRTRLGFRTVYQLAHWWATSPERELG